MYAIWIISGEVRTSPHSHPGMTAQDPPLEELVYIGNPLDPCIEEQKMVTKEQLLIQILTQRRQKAISNNKGQKNTYYNNPNKPNYNNISRIYTTNKTALKTTHLDLEEFDLQKL